MTTALPIVVSNQTLSPGDLPRDNTAALYVHVPFCFHKCHYCDFYSITRQTDDRMAEFVNRVLREADLWTQADGPVLQPRTIFFGGGTPSLLPLQEMSRLIDGLKSRIDFSRVDEFTIEVNPATASLEYLQMLRAHGVNRLSFGAQSFDREELKILERHHDPQDVFRSIELARSAKFSRLNIDLIYAIPGQTLQSWQRSLDAAVELNLSHYSCYGLTYETNTAMAVRKRLGHFVPAADELELEMLHFSRSRLSALNCPPYEISNYATTGEECRHNLNYWNGENYIGLGPSAASHVSGTRFKNRSHLREWENAIDAGELPATDIETLSPSQRAGELVMLQLRLSAGVNFDSIELLTGENPNDLYREEITTLSQHALIERTTTGIRLATAGLPLADAVAAEFL